ncbi:MAG: hypothetical protein KKA76_04805 [Proteobacteria bacterium]|nr:hypothetical protein [Pseudomonadota bacterium]
MNNSQVPQHNISTYANNKKAIYATDENGEYTIVASSGWNVEEEATRQALLELERLAADAYERVASGKVSPLYFHMYDRRMDLQTLAQATGMFQWRIKRHFRPKAFGRLSARMVARYADTLGISVEQLCTLPTRGESGV